MAGEVTTIGNTCPPAHSHSWNRVFQTLGHGGGVLSILTTLLWGGCWDAIADIAWGDDATSTTKAWW